ncbi:dehydrogenase/reductase SDR family member on chromosome X-like [Acropora millepora]|uniref:dehydrogenase/reductase SDR family member on chromosome X-like n=1 Tax=Acropora millepora TaxID=45264 RepID=UPI001CF3CC46|nr:dehydrogenase/reductase SDR family member on chromosome X-like [Acropora millepora]
MALTELSYFFKGGKEVLIQYFTKHNSMEEFPNLDGRVAIITGGNRGIGLETVKGLCKAHVTVIIACRDENSAEKAIKEVKEEFPAAKVDFMKLDLGSLKSIQTFAKNFKEKGLPLHILINNAGIMCPPYGTTEDGFELTFGINHLGHFALTNLLLDELIKSGSQERCSRIITLSSVLHRQGKIKFDDLSSKKYYSALEAYNQSKLANVLFSYELNRRLKEKNCPVTSNAVHPGIVNTELFHGLPWCLKIPQDGLVYLLFKTPKQGADSSLYVALSPEIEGLGGLYFVNSSPSQSSEESHREDLQKKLWKISCELTGIPE